MEYFREEPAAEITNKKGGDMLEFHLTNRNLSDEEYRETLRGVGIDDDMIDLLLEMRAQ